MTTYDTYDNQPTFIVQLLKIVFKVFFNDCVIDNYIRNNISNKQTIV